MNTNKKISTKIIYFGGYRGHQNLGDDAMALNLMKKISVLSKDTTFIPLVNHLKNPLPNNDFSINYQLNFFPHQNKITKLLYRFPMGNKINYYFQLFRVLGIYFNLFIIYFFNNTPFLNNRTKKTIKTIKSSHLIWIGGGGTINDIAEISGVIGTFILILIGSFYKKKIIITGQGFGPLDSPINIMLVKYFLKKIEFIGVRDFKNSKNLLLKLGVNKEKIHSVGDDAISLSTIEDSKINKILFQEQIELHKSLKIGFCMRSTNYRTSYSKKDKLMMASVLNQLIEQYDAHIYFIPSLYGNQVDDRNSNFEIYKNLNNYSHASMIKKEYSAYEIKSIFTKMDICLSFTYHPLVFALSESIPCMGLFNVDYYHLKFEGLLEWFNMKEFSININKTNEKSIFHKAEKLIHNSKDYREIISKEASAMSQRLDFMISNQILPLINPNTEQGTESP